MNKTIFKISPKVLFTITALVTGLLVFVWLHWHGQRQTELIVFSVLTILASTLYTLRSELSLSVTNREVCGKLTWLGLAIRKIVVRMGLDDGLYLTEEISHGSQKSLSGTSSKRRASLFPREATHRDLMSWSRKPGRQIAPNSWILRKMLRNSLGFH